MNFIQSVDKLLCSDTGMDEKLYQFCLDVFWNDEEVLDILKMTDATDGAFYFPEWHPGIEGSLMVDCGSRSEYLSECFNLGRPPNRVDSTES